MKKTEEKPATRVTYHPRRMSSNVSAQRTTQLTEETPRLRVRKAGNGDGPRFVENRQATG